MRVSSPDDSELNLRHWLNGTIAAGRRHTIGLKADGTVTAAGWNEYGQCDAGDWSAIRLPGD